jgi:parvulin-like peptidyl-prolyl isomerase
VKSKRIVVAVLFGLLLVTAGCGEEEELDVSLVSLIPKDEAVVVIENDGETHEISGAWLRNLCASQRLLLAAHTQGLPLRVNEVSLIKSSRQIITKMYVGALEAKRRGLTVTEQEISDRLSSEVSNFESTEVWRQTLEDSGLTVDERREQIEIELLFEKYREEIVLPEVKETFATPENAKKFYEKQPDLWVRPLRVHLFQIHRTVARDAPETERELQRSKIEEARDRHAAGEDFAELARELSTAESALRGGELGWVTEAWPIRESLREPSLALQKDEVSDIIEGPDGFYLFWAKDREDARKAEFEEVREDIQERIANEALTNQMERQIAELRQQMDIKFLDLTPYIGEEPAKAGDEPGAAPPVESDAAPAAAG